MMIGPSRRAIALMLLAICVGLQGCADRGGFAAPRRTPAEVVEATNAFAARNEITIENYSVGSVDFDYVKRRWHVFYEGKSLAIGDHFTIIVSDERAEEIELIPGR